MTIRERLFLVAGNNFFQRKLAIENIKRRILKSKNTPCNIFTFYSREVDFKTLGEEIFTLSFDKVKIVIFKEANQLSAAAKEFLLKHIARLASAVYIILEVDKPFARLTSDKKIINDKFFSFVLKKACLFRVASGPRPASIDDFRMNLRRNDLAASLYVLEKLFEDKNKARDLGPLILGILTSKVTYFNNSPRKERCLNYLWTADRAIKGGGSDARLALEVLLVKLLKA